MAIAKALKNFRRLTVVTNAINIAAELSSKDFEIILTGGTLRKNSSSCWTARRRHPARYPCRYSVSGCQRLRYRCRIDDTKPIGLAREPGDGEIGLDRGGSL